MPGESQTQRGTVVVGVDASEGADAALEWAVAEARLRGARLRVVFAWTLSYPRGEGYGYMIGPLDVPPYGSVSDQRHAAEGMLERATARLWPPPDGLQIDREVAEGPAAEVLVDAAADADLLVVGSRGHGGFVGLLLGSVSQQCVHQAACPVVIVRAAHDPDPTRVEPAETGAAA
ncbi:MAG TPA: universal stress protein [Solirubrobacteraceae bacterium]|nr:universal stress protein [Solirubrobacteraceae bacterium]